MIITANFHFVENLFKGTGKIHKFKDLNNLWWSGIEKILPLVVGEWVDWAPVFISKDKDRTLSLNPVIPLNTLI